MINNLYFIKDSLVGFKPPFVAPNDAFAIRMFSSLVNSIENNDVKSNPGDYQLFCAGSFDDKTGELTSDVKFIVNAIDLIQKVGG